MTIGIILIAFVAAFVAFRFIAGMVKFVVLAVIVLALFYFMTGGFGA